MAKRTREELLLMETYRMDETQWGALVGAFAKSGRRKMSRSQCVRRASKFLGELTELVKPESIAGWLHKQVKGFDGATPLQVIERGQMDRFARMIDDIGSGNPS